MIIHSGYFIFDLLESPGFEENARLPFSVQSGRKFNLELKCVCVIRFTAAISCDLSSERRYHYFYSITFRSHPIHRLMVIQFALKLPLIYPVQLWIMTSFYKSYWQLILDTPVLALNFNHPKCWYWYFHLRIYCDLFSNFFYMENFVSSLLIVPNI